MATSGSTNFNVTAGDIIEEALGLIGVHAIGEPLDSSETSSDLRTLNMMLKAWYPKMGLWLNRELSLFFQKDQIFYEIGPTGDHCAPNAAKTEIATAAVSGASSIVVDSVADFSDTFDRDGLVTAVTASAGTITLDGDLVTNGIATLSGDRKILIFSVADESGDTFSIVGQNAAGVAVSENITGPNITTVYSVNTYKTITSVTTDGAGTGNIEIGQVGDPVGTELDEDSIHWTFIAAALSTTISLVTALTDSVAVDNHVYSYTEKTSRPIEIVESRRITAEGTDVPIIPSGRLDYELLSDKKTPGIVNQIYYDKQLGNGIIKAWPLTINMKEYLKFTARIPVQDLDELTNDFEVAQEWFEAIAWNLALRLFPKHEKTIPPDVAAMALQMLDDAMATDSENTSSYIQIGTGWHGQSAGYGGGSGKY